jgi:hypothetical protein
MRQAQGTLGGPAQRASAPMPSMVASPVVMHRNVQGELAKDLWCIWEQTFATIKFGVSYTAL